MFIGLLILLFLAGKSRIYACGAGSCDEKYFGTINGFPSDEIMAITSDKKGNIYVGTSDKGLVVIAPKEEKFFQVIDSKNSLSYNSILSLGVSDNNTLWIGTSGGLNGLSLGNLTSKNARFFAEDGLKDNICLSVLPMANGSNLWVGTTRGLVMKSAGFKRYTTDNDLPDNIIQSLSSDPDNNVWVGTSKGLVKMAGIFIKKFDLETRNQGMAHWVYGLATISNISKDYSDKVRMTFDAMLTGLGRRDPRLNGIDSGFRHAEVVRFIADLKKEYEMEISRVPLYIATNNGCFSVDRSSEAVVKQQDGWFTSVAVNSYGRAFVAGKDLTVYSVGLEKILEDGFNVGGLIRSQLRKIIDEYITMAEEERRKNLGTATAELIKKFDGKTQEEIETWIEKLLGAKIISSMCFSPLGHLWVGVKGGGLFRFNPVIVNHDSFSYSIVLFNQLLKEDQENPENPRRKEEKPLTGFKLTTPQPPFPEVPEITRGLQICRMILPGTSAFWIGKWSELNWKDCKDVTEFLAQWGYDLCLMNLARVIKSDPYVIIPIAEPDAPSK